VQVVLINSNDQYLYPEETYAAMVERARRDELPIPYLHDQDQRIARAYGPTCTFHAFVLDRSRTLRYEGRFDDARLPERATVRDLENALDDVLAGRRVRVPRTQPFGCSLDLTNLSGEPGASSVDEVSPRRAAPSFVRNALLLGAGAWIVTVAADVTGLGPLLHHDALVHAGAVGAPPVWLAIGGIVVGWQVMVAAMMVPASVPTIRVFQRASLGFARPAAEAVGFAAAFAVAWGIFGILAFLGDFGLHQFVHASPWLGQHPNVIQAGLFGLAGTYQLLPGKRRSLEACRAPFGVAACCTSPGPRVGYRAGARHALDCLQSSWALMLLLFAAGIADLTWMMALTALMAYEALGQHGHAVARTAGAIFLLVAAATLVLGASVL
jgi:predicted metal-binding membrane protein